jgi:NAD(P)-dependent dehydrogenase (short-subunit alcohol dehydrogenase family)
VKMDFEDKVVVVTGATSGIGRSTALGFARAGARVAGIGRDRGALDELSTQGVISYRIDLTHESETAEAVRSIMTEHGGIDILVNAAGIIGTGNIDDTTLADYDTMMDINVRSVLHLMQLCLPSIVERTGNIVNVSSVTGIRAFPGVLAYCVSKAALDQLTRCAALELAAKGVRVNSVNPGVVRTNLHRRSGMDAEAYAAFVERSKATHPLGRIGEPGEIADLIMYLASDKAGWITGATYSIDGGRAETCAR